MNLKKSSRRSIAVVCVLLCVVSILTLSGCFGLIPPNPDVPVISYCEFPFVAVYETDGERFMYEDSIICEYSGYEWSGAGGGKMRKWALYYGSGAKELIIHQVNGKVSIGLRTGQLSALLVGDETDTRTLGTSDLYTVTKLDNGKIESDFVINDLQIFTQYGVRITDLIIPPPIENTFLPEDAVEEDPVKKPNYIDKIGLEYAIDRTTREAVIIGYSGEAETLTIPATARGGKVIAIQKGAFIGSSLTEVVIPDGVEKIGEEAFACCCKLTSVVIPDSVSEIGDKAFARCTRLTAISIPDGVQRIGTGTFRSCADLSEVVIPESVAEIGESAFEYCFGLKSITLPDSITSIGKSAFAYCISLESAVLPANLTVVEEMTFCDCYNLSEVTLPENLESFGQMAFANCPAWRDIMFPKE